MAKRNEMNSDVHQNEQQQQQQQELKKRNKKKQMLQISISRFFHFRSISIHFLIDSLNIQCISPQANSEFISVRSMCVEANQQPQGKKRRLKSRIKQTNLIDRYLSQLNN